MVERYVRDVEAAGSNPVTSTVKNPCKSVVYAGLQGFRFSCQSNKSNSKYIDFNINTGKNTGKNICQCKDIQEISLR